jgi:hypothetical protein
VVDALFRDEDTFIQHALLPSIFHRSPAVFPQGLTLDVTHPSTDPRSEEAD